jgi:SAM-dependent methyltransferase
VKASDSVADDAGLRCRSCGHRLSQVFVDLGASPLCQKHLEPAQLSEMEPFYPLRVFVCDECFLVQVGESASPEALFGEYAYFSSYSDTWLRHCREYAEAISDRLDLDAGTQVVEVASNDGHLLKLFAARGIPVLGIEPARNVAAVARERGIPTEAVFFGEETARRLVANGMRADLLIGNNVLAHVPDINDFARGLSALLKPEGVITIEFPHVLHLIRENQFDTIYHEHFFYLSLVSVERVLDKAGLVLFDVEEVPTHGGSLRIYARHRANPVREAHPRLAAVRAREREAALDRLEGYRDFPERVARVKRDLLAFLVGAKRDGKRIAGYGAPGKGNTLLNHCGIRTDFLDYTVDRSPYKQGKYTPGTRIPIHAPDRIALTRPDYVLILPWNLKDEIMEQLAFIRGWGGRFVVPIPELAVF